jgi:hypothetical protein
VLSWVNYHDEMRQWISEVMPLIEQAGLRQPLSTKNRVRGHGETNTCVLERKRPEADLYVIIMCRLGRAESSPWLVKPALGYKARRLDPDAEALMNPFWSQIARELSPYVPGEQPRIANLVKLNTNESPFGPSPLAAFGRSDSHRFQRARLHRSAFERKFCLCQPPGETRAGIRGGVARTRGAGAAFQQAAHGALSAHHCWDGRRHPTANRSGGGYPGG